MSRPVFYRNVNGEEVMAPIKDIPSKCDDCCYVAIREEYRDYDDLEGLDIYDKYISCNANGMLLCKCRVEGSSNHYDYGYETRTLAEKPDNCPLY